ncbi:hypothetical protein Tco_1003910 [Tanacetum coccineum]|uniref:Uncharacterized protein n=1 Tax=Tanacetum coccineum TaxID=301880 RepID=A0ABQ5FAW9_9ASTR
MINIKRTPFGSFLLRPNAPFGCRDGGGSGDVMVVLGDDDVGVVGDEVVCMKYGCGLWVCRGHKVGGVPEVGRKWPMVCHQWERWGYRLDLWWDVVEMAWNGGGTGVGFVGLWPEHRWRRRIFGEREGVCN